MTDSEQGATSLSPIEMRERLANLAEHLGIAQADYAKLPLSERAFRAIWELETEVSNGGFNHYFLSGAGLLATEAFGALRLIGASTVAELLEQARKLADSNSLSEANINALDELDQRFYAEHDRLITLLYAFVSKHAEERGITKHLISNLDDGSSRPTTQRLPLLNPQRHPYFLIVIAIMLLVVLGSLTWLPS